MKNLLLILAILGITFVPVFAQDQPASQPTDDEQAKEKAEREKNAYQLLEQVIDEAQSLRLPENRVRVQITAADLLWDNNQGRARSLFGMAAEGVAELNRNQQNTNNRRGGGPGNRTFQMRQELVLAAARHDAQLAYQMLAATKPASPVELDQNARNRMQITPDDNLEQVLLGRVAALDPKLAATNAEQMMDKGTFPRTLPDVLTQLQKQDADAAAKLADKTLKKVEANLLTSNDAVNLAQILLSPGPRSNAPVAGRMPLLDSSAYVDLMGNLVDAALKASAGMQGPQRFPTSIGVVQGRRGIGNGGSVPAVTADASPDLNTARRLLAGLQATLPLIDQYLPAKSAAVRQKLTELGITTQTQGNFVQALSTLSDNPTTDALLQTAASAPPGMMQSRLYQQAAYKALEDGDTTRARQIATDHLQANARDAVMQRIDFRELALKADGTPLEQINQMVARAQSDEEKLNLLIQFAQDTQKVNPKLAGQLLDEAKQMTSRRATSYDQFEQQLTVARAFETVDTARSFEVLDPGINQLNELLSAAAVLNGFEMNMFRDGEMSMQANTGLTSMVNRFGQELAQLARTDFQRSETLAGRFQLAEPRILARLAIVQGLLGVKPNVQTPVGRTFFRN